MAPDNGGVPEGDTVWLSARVMHDALGGRVLTRTDFRVPRLATCDLTGRAVSEVVSRGKHLLTRVEGGVTVHTHFEMDGAWRTYRPGARWSGGPAWQVRAVLENAQWQAVGYRLPVLEVVPTRAEHRMVGHLGPDLLGADWDEQEALRRLGADPAREVGAALLDQRNLAGIGNLYKTEVLFLGGVTPWTPVADVPDLPGIVREAHRLMHANKNDWPQITTGGRRRGPAQWVFERAGLPCLHCGTRIRRGTQGPPGRERVCCWCPQCQRGPAPTTRG